MSLPVLMQRREQRSPENIGPNGKTTQPWVGSDSRRTFHFEYEYSLQSWTKFISIHNINKSQ